MEKTPTPIFRKPKKTQAILFEQPDERKIMVSQPGVQFAKVEIEKRKKDEEER